MSLQPRRLDLRDRVRTLVRAIEDDDDAAVEAVLRLSRSRRLFAPLAFTVGAFAMLFQALRMLLANWRLALIQVLPAMWIWLAMYDLRAHVLHGKSYNALRGPVLIPINLAMIAITAAAFLLNAVFAFAIAGPPPPAIRPALAQARNRAPIILSWGAVVGLLLGLSTTVATRWKSPWFALSLGIVIGVMMISYVAVPSRLIGIRPTQTRREKAASTALNSALSFTVCTPPYLLGRLGILMLGSPVLRIPGIFVLALGFTLHVGTTGAVRAIKMSVKLTGRREPVGPRPG